MAKNKKGPTIKKGLDEWMGTYADMVTLLFCFFVMLYMINDQDDTKIQYFFQAFTPGGQYINTVVGREPEGSVSNEDANSDVPGLSDGTGGGGEMPKSDSPHVFDALYSRIRDLIDEHELDDSMEISASAGVIRIRLFGEIGFEGNSAVLNQRARDALTHIYPSIKAVRDYIESVHVQGHTAQVIGTGHWDLSSLRAASVVDFLDLVEMVQSEKFKAEGFGQHDPLIPGNSDEANLRNRRVEIIINRMSLPPDLDRFVSDIMQYDYNAHGWNVDHAGNPSNPNVDISNAVQAILKELEERRGARPDDTVTPPPPSQSGSKPIGPRPGGMSGVSESDFSEPEPSENGENGENGTPEE